MKTNRRDFIKIMATTSSVILIPSILNAKYENNENDAELNSWNGHNKEEKDIRIKVLSYAILAANPHNKQAWLIDLKDGENFDLYVDKTRLLEETDPYYRQIHIGQGTFLENVSIAASNFSYKAQIKYFPQGMYSNQTLEDKAVASIKLIKDSSVQKDKLFDVILSRHSNKRDYENKLISKEKIEILQNEINKTLGKFYTLNFESNIDKLKTLRDIAINAMKIESSNNKRDLETIEMFRFNNAELKKYRDGFGLAQNGTTGVKKWMLQTFFMSREQYTKDPHSFGKEGISITTNQVNSSHTFGWLTSDNNTREDQVKIGRVYERLNLLASSLGLVMHPLSQVLQEYSDMKKLQKDFLNKTNTKENETVQMFFRLGYAQETNHSPRREIKNMLKG